MTAEQAPSFEHLDESWARALAVVAHPDDLEYGSAAAIARWTDQGKQVTYCLVTSGEAGIDGMLPEVARGVREDEQRRAASIVGVDVVEFLGLPDGVLEYGVSLRREIAAAVRRHRPDIVITNNFRSTWDGATVLNQADHIAVGMATLDAVRDAANRWIFPDQIDAGLERWDGVREVWASSSPTGHHGVDVTATFDRGVASLQAHEAYLAGLAGDHDAAGMLRQMGTSVGARLGCQLGAPFEMFQVG